MHRDFVSNLLGNSAALSFRSAQPAKEGGLLHYIKCLGDQMVGLESEGTKSFAKYLHRMIHFGGCIDNKYGLWNPLVKHLGFSFPQYCHDCH